MNKLLRHCRRLAIITLSLMLCACGSTDGTLVGFNAESVARQPEVQPGWPPAEAVQRSLSSDSVEQLGSDFAEVGGGAHAASTVCKLNNGIAPWAIYSLAGFNFVQLDSVRIDFNKLVGEGTVMYIGVANYSTNRWQWFQTPNNGPYTFTPVNGADYYSPLGNFHIALLRTGPATIDVQKLTFFRSGEENVPAPQNLRSDNQVKEYISLLWDAVPGVIGYNVYRARVRDLSDVQKVNTEVVLTNSYEDPAPLNGLIYYYYVTAITAVESPPSNVVDIFSPNIDMPAPQNPRVVSSTPTTVTIGWDWDEEVLGPPPAKGFRIYMKAEPDFNLDLLGLFEVSKPSPAAREGTITGLVEGSLYYYRICGVTVINERGRMTDDLPAVTGETWNWTNVSPIAAGGARITALETGGDISVVWHEFGSVVFARGLADNWSFGPCGLQGGAEFFEHFLDIDESGGDYLISTFDSKKLDLYASFGNPTDGWTKEFVAAGYTKDPNLESPSAGNHCKAAITADNYNIIHKDVNAEWTYMATRPRAGGSWSKTEVRSFVERDYPLEYDMKRNGDELKFLLFSYEDHELYSGLGPAPYQITQISDNMGANNGIHLDMCLTPGGWVTPSYDTTNKDLYLLRENGSAWDSEDIKVQPGNSSGYGRNARIANYKTGLICVYLNSDINPQWYSSVFDGTEWFTQKMLLPLNPGTDADIAVIDDIAYFIVPDKDEHMVYCVTASLPPIGNV